MGTLKPQSNGTTIQKYGDWYTGRWWVGCYIWYSEEGNGRGMDHHDELLTHPVSMNYTSSPWPRPGPSSLYQMLQPTHQRLVYQLHIIRCGTIIAFSHLRVKDQPGQWIQLHTNDTFSPYTPQFDYKQHKNNFTNDTKCSKPLSAPQWGRCQLVN